MHVLKITLETYRTGYSLVSEMTTCRAGRKNATLLSQLIGYRQSFLKLETDNLYVYIVVNRHQLFVIEDATENLKYLRGILQYRQLSVPK